MVKIDVKGCNSFVKESEYQTYVEKALAAYDVLDAENGAGNDFLGWKTLPVDIPESLICEFESIRDDWKNKGVNLVIVIGIGGSYLGARCAIEALGHQFVRKEGVPQVVFAGNNLSEEYLAELMDLAKTSNTAVIVISKSGTTTEPAVAFRIFKEYIEQTYGKSEASERIVAITDAKKGALKTLATQEGYKSFIVPDNVGGRYSVLTPVGLLPIVIAGFDVRAMLKGAADQRAALSVRSAENPAVQYAAMRNLLHSEYGKAIEIFVVYNPKFTYLAEWWKQLYGESEGKEGKGLFPASVEYTADLHSMGQYLQEGRRNLFETVVRFAPREGELTVPYDEENGDGLNFLAGRTISELKQQAMDGTLLAHVEGGVPNIRICCEERNAFTLGELIYFFCYACGLSGYLLDVNPFDQPGVEAYKKNMFALLGKPGYEELGRGLREKLHGSQR